MFHYITTTKQTLHTTTKKHVNTSSQKSNTILLTLPYAYYIEASELSSYILSATTGTSLALSRHCGNEEAQCQMDPWG